VRVVNEHEEHLVTGGCRKECQRGSSERETVGRAGRP
jgi:hypothetical protein